MTAKPISKTRSFVYLVIARLFGSLLGLIAVPLYLHSVGENVYGAFVTAAAAAAFVALADLGFTPAAVRRMTEEMELGNQDRFWVAYRANVALYGVVALTILVATLLVAPRMAFEGALSRSQSVGLFGWAAAAVVCQLLNVGTRSFLQASGDFATAAKVDAWVMFAASAASIAGVWSTKDILWLPGGQVLGLGSGVLIALLIATRRGAWRRMASPPSYYREYLLFSLKSTVNRVVALLFMNGERLLISRAVPAAQMANLDTANRGPMTLNTVAATMHDPILRGITQAQVQGVTAFSREFLRLSMLALTLGILFVAIPCAFADPLLQLWLGSKKFEGSGFLMVTLGAFWASQAVNVVLGNSCIAWSQPNLILPFSVLQAGVILGLAYPVASAYGVAGIGVLKLVSQISVIPMMVLVCRRFAREASLRVYMSGVGALCLVGGLWTCAIFWMCRMQWMSDRPWLCLPLIPVAMAACGLSIVHLRLIEVPAPVLRVLRRLRIAPRGH